MARPPHLPAPFAAGEPPRDGKTYIVNFTLSNPKAPEWSESTTTNARWCRKIKQWLYSLNGCEIKQSHWDDLTIHYHTALL